MSESFEEEDLVRYLEAEAELESFYIVRSKNIVPGLVHYVDRDRNAWILMEDDDLLVEACIRFLIARGNPVFESSQAAADHEASLKQLTPGSGLGN